MKKIRMLLCSIMMPLLMIISGCFPRELYDELDKIETVGNYTIVGQAGLRLNHENYYFNDQIERKLRSEGKKLYSQGSLVPYDFVDDKMYFFYRYYWSGDIEKDYEKTYFNLVFGYFNCKNGDLTFLEYFLNINSRIEYNFVNIYNRYAFLIFDNVFKVYDLVKQEIIEEIDNVEVQPRNPYSSNYKTYNESFILKKNNEFIYYKNENQDYSKYYLSIQDDLRFLNLTNDNALFTKTNDLGVRTYKAYNFITGEELDSETVNEMKAINTNENLHHAHNEVIYRDYIIHFEEDKIEFTNSASEEVNVLTIDDVKAKSDEYNEITTIFKKEATFGAVKVIDEQLYIIMCKIETPMGLFYPASIPSLVFSYDMDSGNLTYRGYYGYIYYDILHIYIN